jgi:hypothetical protein
MSLVYFVTYERADELCVFITGERVFIITDWKLEELVDKAGTVQFIVWELLFYV